MRIHTCTTKDPFDPGIHIDAYHPDAFELDDDLDDGWPYDRRTWYCPTCGLKWYEGEQEL